MKKLLLLLCILLLTASFDEISKDTRIGKMLQARSVDSFLMSVSFWIDDSNDKLNAHSDMNSHIHEANAQDQDAEQGAEAPISQKQAQESTANPLATPNLADTLAQNAKANNIVILEKDTSLEEKQNSQVPSSNEDEESLTQEGQEIEQVQEKQNLEQTQAAEVNENQQESTQEQAKVKDIQEISSQEIQVDFINVKSFNNSYQASFTLLNKSDVQQSGRIKFFLVFDDNSMLEFEEVGTYRTRYQVEKKYSLAKTDAIREHLAKAKAQAILLELQSYANDEIFLRQQLNIK